MRKNWSHILNLHIKIKLKHESVLSLVQDRRKRPSQPVDMAELIVTFLATIHQRVHFPLRNVEECIMIERKDNESKETTDGVQIRRRIKFGKEVE